MTWPRAVGFARNRVVFLERLTRRYGDVVYFELGGIPFAILNHPDYVRDVLVTRHRDFHKGLGLQRAKLLLGEGLLTSEDEFHTRQRRVIQPMFHRERVTEYGATMIEYAEGASSRWTSGRPIDVASEMSALALAIAGKTLFNAEVGHEASEVGEALSAAMQSFNIAMLPFGDRLVKLPIPPARRFRAARGRLDAIVYRLIARARASATPGRDVLSILVAARDEEGDGSGMTDEQIRDEAMTLLLAGHETTANALTWAWYLLSQSPAAEQAMHDEVDRVTRSGRPTVDMLPRLTFTRAVLAESMRLFPPAYVLGRRALVPYTVPGTDYVIPPRTVVLMSQYLLHRDARFWPRSEAFTPERWTEMGQSGWTATAQKFAYFPFGAGPRVCIGEHFAWMEGTLALATIARRWRFALAPGQRIALEPIITLRPKYGMRMVAEERSAEASRIAG